jgi:murein peptide amidase A
MQQNFDVINSRIQKYFPVRNTSLTNYYQETKNKKYNLDKYILGEGNPLRALISAGIHGDEPSGVEAILAFLETDYFRKYSNIWEITFLPCVNPYGYEHGVRENHEGKDLNRLFKHLSPPQEVAFAKSAFQGKFDLTIELHEDFSSPGYYLYQKGTHADGVILCENILLTVKDIMPINLNMEIDGYPAQDGIITPETDFSTMDWWPMALFSLSKNSRMCLTLETASHFPMDIRVEAHLRAVDTALSYFVEEIKT